MAKRKNFTSKFQLSQRSHRRLVQFNIKKANQAKSRNVKEKYLANSNYHSEAFLWQKRNRKLLTNQQKRYLFNKSVTMFEY